jgi:hypothetical protein
MIGSVVSAGVLLLIVLATPPGGGKDAGAHRDASPPPWLPGTRRGELHEEVHYGLRRSGDGFVYQSATFTAHVARDGVVTFQDKHADIAGLFFPFAALRNLPRPKGPTLESTVRDHFDQRRRAPADSPAEPPPLPNQIDWEAVCPRGSNCDVRTDPTLIQVRGNRDLTDEIMRAYGQDPYARDKARFLSATFEFRIKLAIEARKADLESAIDQLPEQLDDVWGDTRYSPRERRRILYELWLETDRTASGGRAARTIADFIRRRLACASPDGYTAEELATFARLHPDRHFAPADCPPAPTAK